MYDDLNLDEEEEKFGLVNDERESDESEDESEGLSLILFEWIFHLMFFVRPASSDTVEKTRRRKRIE